MFGIFVLFIQYLLNLNISKSNFPNMMVNENGWWQKHGAPIPTLTLNHTGCTSSSHALPAPCCSIPSHLSCIKRKLQRIALTYAAEDGVCCSDALAAVQSSAE